MTITTQTLVPAFVGIAFFGDEVRHGLWATVVIGVAMTLVGATIISTIRQKQT